MKDLPKHSVALTPHFGQQSRPIKTHKEVTWQLDIDQLIAAARRQARVAGYSVVLAIGIGMMYLATAVPQYTAGIDLLLDNHKGQDQLASSIAELTLDTGAIDSQVEVMKSDKVALLVVKSLALDTDPEFSGSSGSFLGAILHYVWAIINVRDWFTSNEIIARDASEKARENAVYKLKSSLSVKRIAKTYVISISYTSPNPAKAQAIANAFADAYFAEQLDSRYVIAKRAAKWLNDRIAELKENSLKTDLAVQRFKAEKGILSTGSISSNGTQTTQTANLVEDQQLIEMTSQISQAHAETARMEARVRQINEIIKSGKTEGAVTESLGNPVITDLRQKYLRASKQASEFSAKVGINHYQVTSLRNEMVEYEHLIFQELERIAQTYASDLEVARTREKNLNESMASLVSQKAVSNETMVQLRELEREADVFKNLYQTFLQRYQDAIQRESLPSSEARVISAAALPGAPSWPKRPMVLGFSTLFGLLVGGAIGAYRENRDRVFRVAHQVRDELGLDLIGMLPCIQTQQLAIPEGKRDRRFVRVSTSIQRYAIDAPLSGFAEVLRSAKVEVDLAHGKKKGARIIGIASVLPGEGKTTVSKNLASLIAFLGSKTLLIDGDMRSPGLTRNIAWHAPYGLTEVLRDKLPLQDAILTEPETGLAVLPAVIKKRLLLSSELISSRAMAGLLVSAGTFFDYIIIDLPPIGPVVDVRAAARLFDAFLLVVEWGKTARSVVKNAIIEDDMLYDKCIGVIFNKVNVDKLDLYNNHSSKNYYHKTYKNYYIDQPKRSAQ
jgi:succinoglycan biosynthesis transport protein ExoP